MRNPNLQRAILLYQQSRHELAEKELRQALAAEPDEPYAHSLLALCLAHREEFAEATTEAQHAIGLAPDFSFAHYAAAHVLFDRNRMEESLAAVREAVRLDPTEAAFHALESQIHLSERQWPAALESAERGLREDPGHITCTNLRAMALVKLGRRSEAGATIGGALERNPDNSLTHANQGWTLLEQGDPTKALEHFKEALRLNPDNEWARRGIVEALKARHFIYAVMLKYFLFMARLRGRLQWGIILGAYIGNLLLAGLAASHPKLGPWIWPIRIVYISFALMTWLADPFFNLVLRMNRFGRLALSEEQTLCSNWMGGLLTVVMLAVAYGLVMGFGNVALGTALVAGLLLLPVVAVFKCSAGWPRRAMAIYTAVMGVAGAASILLSALPGRHLSARGESLPSDLATALIGIFFIGAIGSGLVANILIMQRPRR